MTEFQVLTYLLLFSLGGYAIGRTLTQESLFDGTREWVKSKFYYDTSQPDIYQEITGEVVRRVGPVEFEVVSVDGYRTDLPRPIAVLLGKIADLFSCVFCGSGQAAFQLGFWTVVTPLFPFWFPYIPIEISLVAAAVGVTYMINDYLNRRLEE